MQIWCDILIPEITSWLPVKVRTKLGLLASWLRATINRPLSPASLDMSHAFSCLLGMGCSLLETLVHPPLSFPSWFLVTYTRLCLLLGDFLTSCLCLDYWILLGALSICPHFCTQSHKQICDCWLISGKALAPSLFYALVILCCHCSFFHGFL